LLALTRWPRLLSVARSHALALTCSHLLSLALALVSVREKLEAVNKVIEIEAGGKGAMDAAVNAKAEAAIALEREKAKEKQQKLVKAALLGLASLRAHLTKSLVGLGPPLLHDDSPLPAPYIKCSPPPVPHSNAEHFEYDEKRKRWNHKQPVGEAWGMLPQAGPLTVAAPPLMTIIQCAKTRKGNVPSTSPETRFNPPVLTGGLNYKAHSCPPHVSPASRRAPMSKNGSSETAILTSPHRLRPPSFEEAFGIQGSGSQHSSPSTFRPRLPERQSGSFF